jgi:hypothetical protein
MPRLMKQAAIGIRMHSGWGALVSVTGPPQALEIIDRRRIVVIEPGGRRAGQPYHHAATLPFSAADKYLKKYAETSRRLALAALREVLEELKSQCHRIAGAAILLAADRALPPLEQILAAHPLIHTAEGEFFRMVVREACEQLRVHVIGIRERDLEDQAKAVFGSATIAVQERISGLGKSLGPPWTRDQKSSALAAAMVLHGQERCARASAASLSQRKRRIEKRRMTETIREADILAGRPGLEPG